MGRRERGREGGEGSRREGGWEGGREGESELPVSLGRGRTREGPRIPEGGQSRFFEVEKRGGSE